MSTVERYFAPIDSAWFRIDQNQLDREWVEQPLKYFELAERLAASKRDLEEARTRLDVTKAERAKMIRGNPAEYGIEKLTESALTEALVGLVASSRAAKAVAALKYETDVLTAAVAAMDHRKSALQKLVDLHGQNYFATPRSRNGESQEIVANGTAARQIAKSRRRREPEPDEE